MKPPQRGLTCRPGRVNPLPVDSVANGARTARMRITVFIRSLGVGGAQISARRLAEALAGRGYTVDLVCTESGVAALQRTWPNAPRVVVLPARSRVGEIRVFARYLRQVRPHAVLSNLTTSNIVAIAAKLLTGRRTAVIAIERQAIPPAGWSRQRVVAYRFLVPILYRWADWVVGVSSGVTREIDAFARLHGSRRLQTVYNWIEPGELQARSRAPVDHAWLRQSKVPVLVAVGRLHPAKDFPTLLDAFAQLNERRAAYLIILGEGPERAALEDRAKRLGIAERVDLPGHVENPYAYIATASALVSSSLFEGHQLALLEAFCLDTPVVATDCRHGAREILQDGRWGELVPPRDPAALAAGMEKALTDPIDGRPRAADFTSDASINRYVELLTEL